MRAASDNGMGEGHDVYFFMITDILQQYDLQKKSENMFKRLSGYNV